MTAQIYGGIWADEDWIDLPLSGRWRAYSYNCFDPGAWPPPQFRKQADGLVVMRGLCVGHPTTGAKGQIGLLPASHRPDGHYLFAIIGASVELPEKVCRMDIYEDGKVLFGLSAMDIGTQTSSYVSLHNIQFWSVTP